MTATAAAEVLLVQLVLQVFPLAHAVVVDPVARVAAQTERTTSNASSELAASMLSVSIPA